MSDEGPPFDVGGVLLERPFAIRRLNHFGATVDGLEDVEHFYTQVLGYRVSDRLEVPGMPTAVFLRHGADHHSFVLLDKPGLSAVLEQAGAPLPPTDINQITWQVGSLQEVNAARVWWEAQGQRIERAGRDMPGSNWHTYLADPDGFVNEVLYGIEQIGWDGYPKPVEMHSGGAVEPPQLPQRGEFDEVQAAIAEGVCLHSGYRDTEIPSDRYAVEGISMPQPFKVVNQGPIHLFVADVGAALRWYREILGLVETETAVWNGYRAHYLRANTEHHSLGLFPAPLKADLDIGDDATCWSFGIQVASHRQLVDALEHFRILGYATKVDELPRELLPGIGHAFRITDPAGLGLLFYHSMEQIGWDGSPRPASERAVVAPEPWPRSITSPDAFKGRGFDGPWF